MTELPDDVREFLGNIARNNFEGRESAKRLLARYPKPQPEWQPGDVVIDNAGLTLMRNDDNIWVPPSADKGLFGDEHIPLLLSADLIARAGRRVYPARFTEHHAPFLRRVAAHLQEGKTLTLQNTLPGDFLAIAADLAGDSDDT